MKNPYKDRMLNVVVDECNHSVMYKYNGISMCVCAWLRLLLATPQSKEGE